MSIDEVLEKLVNDSQYDCAPPDYTAKSQIAQAKQALYKDMIELIGKDKKPFKTNYNRGMKPDIITKIENELRQELRTKLKEYFSVNDIPTEAPDPNTPTRPV